MPEENAGDLSSALDTEQNSDSNLKFVQYAYRESAAIRILEVYFWIIASLSTAWPFISDRLFYPSIELRDIYIQKGQWLFAAAAVVIFPFIFRLIFDALPIQALRRSVREKRGTLGIKLPENLRDKLASTESSEVPLLAPSSSYDWLNRSQQEPKRLLACLATQSAITARGIYSRAGVYLLVGVGIAFSGLAFFYFETGTIKTTSQISSDLMTYAPRFGILFFIELIAFFFLRQYRAAMDEFRYYESLQRHREELLALTLLVETSGKSLDALSLVKQGAYYSGREVLTKGESTRILEARKLEKDEVELLAKVVETVGKKKA